MYEYFINFMEIKACPIKKTYSADIRVNKDTYFKMTEDKKSTLLNKLLCKEYMQEWIKNKLDYN